MTNTPVTEDQGGKDAFHRNHSSEYFSLSLNLDPGKELTSPSGAPQADIPEDLLNGATLQVDIQGTVDASCPTPTSPGGRNRRARASGGEHPQPRRKLPGPWVSAYLVGKDGTCLQPLHFATAHPIPPPPPHPRPLVV